MELTHYEDADFIFVVRFKKVDGETSSYRDICAKILRDLRL